MLKIQVINRQKISRVSAKRLESLGRFVLRAENRKNCSCSVVLLDDKKLLRFHKNYLGAIYKTDVISFPFHEKLEDDMWYLGDVLVSVEHARRMAPVYQNSVPSEVDLYVIHGMLHLLGYDDIEKRKLKRMKRREQRLWSEWKKNLSKKA